MAGMGRRLLVWRLLWVSAVLLLHTLARLGLDIGLIRFLPDETDKPGMINTSFTIVGVLCCSGSGVRHGCWVWAEKLVFVRDNGLACRHCSLPSLLCRSLVELLRQGVFVAYAGLPVIACYRMWCGLRLPLVPRLLVCRGLWHLCGLGSGRRWRLWCGDVGLGCLVAQRSYRPVPTIRR